MDCDYAYDSLDNWDVEQMIFNKPFPKLNLFKNDSYQQSEIDHKNQSLEIDIDFEQKSTAVINNAQQVCKKLVTQKIKKNIKKDRIEKDYKKNICRNIMRHAIKSMNQDIDCSEFIDELVDDSKAFKNFYNHQSEQITGFRVLREHLTFSDEDPIFIQNRKIAFKHYLLWYLKNKSTSMILNGETKNPSEYLRYKNEVLYYYIHQPHEWISNNPDWLLAKETPLQFQSTQTNYNF